MPQQVCRATTRVHHAAARLVQLLKHRLRLHQRDDAHRGGGHRARPAPQRTRAHGDERTTTRGISSHFRVKSQIYCYFCHNIIINEHAITSIVVCKRGSGHSRQHAALQRSVREASERAGAAAHAAGLARSFSLFFVSLSSFVSVTERCTEDVISFT